VPGGAPLSDVIFSTENDAYNTPIALLADTQKNNDYDLLIISPNAFMQTVEPLVGHKNAHGVDTLAVSLDEIYQSTYFPVQGRDCAEEIKYFIKEAVEEWGIRYVMLVGGRHSGLFQEKWWLPVRYVQLDDKSSWEQSYLSDLYFADIYTANGDFSSWDSNDNGIYGEWRGSRAEDADIDLRADVFVGRLACRNKFEVKLMVDKIIFYENNTYGQSWFNKMLCIAGDTYPAVLNPLWEGNEGELGTQRAIDWMPGFTPIKLWASLGTFTGPDDVIDAVSEGCGFLFFDGHGSPMSWATHAPNSTEWIDGLTVWQMPSLNNKGMYPVCVVGGCHNSQFNISLLNFLKIYKGIDEWYSYLWKGETGPECWSWWLTRKINGGSIATLGYSGLGYTKEDKDFTGEATEWLDTHFFWEYGINGTDILGEIWGNVLSAYLTVYPIDWNSPAGSYSAIDVKTAQEWILLGDPSLKIGGYPP
jgi:hypothetical protein